MNPKTPERRALHEFLARHQRFLLTTHVNPDGDGIGSEVAMALWLAGRGKSVRVLNDSSMPAALPSSSQRWTNSPCGAGPSGAKPQSSKPSRRAADRLRSFRGSKRKAESGKRKAKAQH